MRTSHFYRETANENNQFKETKTLRSLNHKNYFSSKKNCKIKFCYFICFVKTARDEAEFRKGSPGPEEGCSIPPNPTQEKVKKINSFMYLFLFLVLYI